MQHSHSAHIESRIHISIFKALGPRPAFVAAKWFIFKKNPAKLLFPSGFCFCFFFSSGVWHLLQIDSVHYFVNELLHRTTAACDCKCVFWSTRRLYFKINWRQYPAPFSDDLIYWQFFKFTWDVKPAPYLMPNVTRIYLQVYVMCTYEMSRKLNKKSSSRLVMEEFLNGWWREAYEGERDEWTI